MAQTELRILKDSRTFYGIQEMIFSSDTTIQALYRQAQELSTLINSKRVDPATHIKASELYAAGVIRLLQREIIEAYCSQQEIDIKDQSLKRLSTNRVSIDSVDKLLSQSFPAMVTLNKPESHRMAIEEILLLQVSQENPALMKKLPDLLSNSDLIVHIEYRRAVELILQQIEEDPGFGPSSQDLFTFLCTPARMSPDSLSGQLQYMMTSWKAYIQKYAKALLRAIDFIQEEDRPYFPPGPGPTQAPEFSYSEEEYEAFSIDSDWMPNVLMVAKSTLVWLDQLSKEYSYPITRLDQIPDRELDLMAERGFSALWLIGLWERSEASKRIKNACGNPEAEASAYSLYGYDISRELGGWEALQNLRERCLRRGIRLASDMVPNHTGLDSQWMVEQPDLFLQVDQPPFPSYSFNGENLSNDPALGIYLEDHYYSQTDAAVIFKRVDHSDGRAAYIYHGNDGTGMPWNDTAQLDYLNPRTREIVIQTIIHVAKNFPIIRFDAAMTLAKKHIQRLWYPVPGSGGDIPSRSAYGMDQQSFNEKIPVEFWREVVDRIAQEVPDTLLLAEAFWMMEGYFVRTLGMHRVYNSAFMNMLKNEENRKYRDTIKNTISFDPEILKRYVNFMNNPDEETAIAQFGEGDKYFGVCTLLVTMPGLPMFGHGQVEGYREKYGMEFRKAYWDERPNQYLVGEHYRRIFPLMKKRYLFSNAEHFALYDMINQHTVNQDVFAYSNQAGSEHALVLYNNAYASAAGWIKRSAPVLKRLDQDERALVTIELHEALSMRGSRHDFTLFRGYHDDLTYIRSSEELKKRGFFASLNGYETQIYLDFREVEDTEGLYAQLCEQLNGAGVRDLEREIKRLRFAEFHHGAAPFYQRETIEQMAALCTEATPERAEALFRLLSPAAGAIEQVWETLPLGTGSLLPPALDRISARALKQHLETISHIVQLRAGNSYLDNALPIMPEIPVVLLSYLLLAPVGASYTDVKLIPDLAGELLLEDHLREPLRELSVPSEEAERLLGVTSVLLRHIGWYRAMNEQQLDENQMLARLVEDPAIRRFIKVNWYQDRQWYHKESMQELFFWLFIAELLAGPDAATAETLSRIMRDWLHREMLAGYQLENLVQ
ncbi:MAG: alpha-amylase [Spirochaetia bacterium]|nr:alpha-amylase [Spirochaetia bacterium]